MRKSSLLTVFIVLTAGAAGYFLRRYELDTSFEPLTGLAVRGAPASQLLAAVSVLLMLAFAAFAVFVYVRFKPPKDYEQAFGTNSLLYPCIFIPVSAIWTYGTVLHFMRLRLPGMIMQTHDMIFLVLSVIAAVSILFFSIMLFQGSPGKTPYLLIVLPLAFLCFWLILLYRQNAANPVLYSFIYQCFAVISAILGYYYTAGFLYGKPSPGKSVLACSCTIYFCAVALADKPGTGLSLIFSAVLLSGAANMILLLRNLEKRKPKIMFDKYNRRLYNL